ncbi:flagellar filament capping protein FliD [Novosphingobium sp. 9]|uniref:flagellar filament capping protein FliD n=1 Tax=Novosphingobium sp. 9 TaxID=2025349 RepID=UPI0021B5F7F9|nr:flagellar filament capping protein FliD [Novosphingobium sp. 9]
MVTSTSSASTTTTSPTTTSLATLLGGGSGVDMLALANNLATAQFSARTSQLSTKTDTLNTKVSTASNIKSMLLALDTSMGTLVRSGDLARTPSVANAAVATATLTGATAPKGSYSLEVSQLAANQTLASAAFGASTETVGAGTLTLRFGTTSGSSFAEDPSHSAVNISIPEGATLADVASAINGANAGVSAYVAQTVNGAQLVMKGTEGAANGFTLETDAASGSGLAKLAWSPSSGSSTLMTTAQDAAFKVDGLPMTATSNSVSTAVNGVKLQLTATNVGAPTTITFADPTSSIGTSMQDLVDALNEVMGALNTATSLGGDLANDAGARTLKRSLMAIGSQTVMPNATGTARTLADLGLKTQRDGTFALDTSRLNATVASDPEGVAAMWTNGVNGVFATVDKVYRDATSTTGTYSLGASISTWTKQLTQIATDQSDLAEQQEALRSRLATQFTASETRISSIKSTMSMLTNQIAQWNKSS